MTVIQTKAALLEQGWAKELINHYSQDLNRQSDFRIGSPSFLRFWSQSQRWMFPRERLTALLNLMAMPSELTGIVAENQALVAKISMDLAPDANFWYDLAALVDQAFPRDGLAHLGELERRLHQFRYLISSHQAQYIRHHFKSDEMTDQEALALFLRGKRQAHCFGKGDYSFKESARLHNKLTIRDGKITYPDNQPSVNIKVLMGFHTEFILDSQGHFLNEVDVDQVTESGVINGASFNYGKGGKRHFQLDVAPVGPHDPAFRKKIKRGFYAPNRSRSWSLFTTGDYAKSYFNPKGVYSLNQESRQKKVHQAIKEFKATLKQL